MPHRHIAVQGVRRIGSEDRPSHPGGPASPERKITYGPRPIGAPQPGAQPAAGHGAPPDAVSPEPAEAPAAAGKEHAADAAPPPEDRADAGPRPGDPWAAAEAPGEAQPGLSQSLRSAASEMLRLADELDRLVALLGAGVFGTLAGTPGPEDGLGRLLAAAQRLGGGVPPQLSSYARLRSLLAQFGRD